MNLFIMAIGERDSVGANSSVVERGIAGPKVTGSNPVWPSFLFVIYHFCPSALPPKILYLLRRAPRRNNVCVELAGVQGRAILDINIRI